MTRVNDILADLQARLAARRTGRVAEPGESPQASGDAESASPPIPSNSDTLRMDSTTSSGTPHDPTADGGLSGDASRPVGDASSGDAAVRYAELEARHADVSDAYLRAKAEAENVRRRADDEIAKARKFAVESFADSLLPVKDSLEAAIAIQAATPEQLLEGVHATLRQLGTALERNKVVEINPGVAEKFDPHRHQAISVVGADQEPNTVVTVLQKGYSIAERVLRPALVTVSAPK